MILRVIVGAYFKQLVWTGVTVFAFVALSFYFLGWWGILTSLIGVPLILFIALGYLINEVKKNPMLMLKSMALSTPRISTAVDMIGDKGFEDLAKFMTEAAGSKSKRGQVLDVEAIDLTVVTEVNADKKKIILNKSKDFGDVDGESFQKEQSDVNIMEQIKKNDVDFKNAQILTEQTIQVAKQK